MGVECTNDHLSNGFKTEYLLWIVTEFKEDLVREVEFTRLVVCSNRGGGFLLFQIKLLLETYPPMASMNREDGLVGFPLELGERNDVLVGEILCDFLIDL